MMETEIDVRKVKVGFKALQLDVKEPFYRHRGDAGMDVCAADDYLILPGQTVLVSTGFAVELPEGYELQVRPRSGLSLKTNLSIANSPGTIDAGFRDEIKLIVHNNSDFSLAEGQAKNDNNIETIDTAYGKLPVYDLTTKGAPHGAYKICRGDRIAQLVLAPIYQVEWSEASGEPDFDRKGGFGHSGLA